MEALEERARKRLELEEVRQKRVALELQLEARRKDAEAAQRRLAELSGKAAVARVPSEGGQVGAREGLGRAARARPVAPACAQTETRAVWNAAPPAACPPDAYSRLIARCAREPGRAQSDGGEAELDAEPDPAQSHAVINERIAQRRREREKQVSGCALCVPREQAGGANLFRCKQSQVATKKLDELNARRLELQQEQDELKKRRVLVAAEAAKERAEAGLCACAPESSKSPHLSPPLPSLPRAVHGSLSRSRLLDCCLCAALNC